VLDAWQHCPLTDAVADAEAMQPAGVVAVRLAVTTKGPAWGAKEPEHVTTNLPAWLVPAHEQQGKECGVKLCSKHHAVATCTPAQPKA